MIRLPCIEASDQNEKTKILFADRYNIIKIVLLVFQISSTFRQKVTLLLYFIFHSILLTPNLILFFIIFARIISSIHILCIAIYQIVNTWSIIFS